MAPKHGSDFQGVPEPASLAKTVEHLLLAAEKGEVEWKNQRLQSQTPEAGSETAVGASWTKGDLQRVRLLTRLAASETQVASKTGHLQRLHLLTGVAAETQVGSKTGCLQRMRLLTQAAASETRTASKMGRRGLSKRVRHLVEVGRRADGRLPVSAAEGKGGVPTRRPPPQVPGSETFHVALKIEWPPPPTDGEEVREAASSRGQHFEAAQKMVEGEWAR